MAAQGIEPEMFQFEVKCHLREVKHRSAYQCIKRLLICIHGYRIKLALPKSIEQASTGVE